jgi:hypothetical protein
VKVSSAISGSSTKFSSRSVVSNTIFGARSIKMEIASKFWFSADATHKLQNGLPRLF